MKIKLYKLVSILLLVGVAVLIYLNQSWAIRQYDKLSSLYYVYKGDKAYSHLKLQKSIDYYNKALKLYPEHYGAWFNLGNIYVVFEDYYSAVEAYEQAIKYNPKMIVARMNYGIVSAEKLGDFDGAIDQYDAIIKTKRHLVSIPFVYSNKKSYKVNKGLAYYNKGLAYRKKALYVGDNYALQREYMGKAIEAYKNAIKILKKHYDSLYNLALAYHLTGDYNNAGLTYCKAISVAPMNYEAHFNLAILLRRLKFYKESLEELEKATSLITDSQGASARQRYVFDVMNEVTRIIISENEKKYMVENIADPGDKVEVKTNAVTYVNGKLVMTDDLDKAVIKNFKTCGSKKIFLDDD